MLGATQRSGQRHTPGASLSIIIILIKIAIIIMTIIINMIHVII